MRTVTYVRNNTVEIVEKPVPEIQPDEVLLKVRGAGLCHSDIAIINFGDDNPLIGGTLGHEVAGTVERIGEDVTGWNVGDTQIVVGAGAPITRAADRSTGGFIVYGSYELPFWR